MEGGPAYVITRVMTATPQMNFVINANENKNTHHDCDQSHQKINSRVMKYGIKQEITATIVPFRTMHIPPDHRDEHSGLKHQVRYTREDLLVSA
jgi:hypothetical protein